MESTASRPRVLVVGLDPYRVPGPWDPKPVAYAIEVGMARLADRGFEAEAFLVGLDGSDDVEPRITIAVQTDHGTASLSAAGSASPTNNWGSSNPSST